MHDQDEEMRQVVIVVSLLMLMMVLNKVVEKGVMSLSMLFYGNFSLEADHLLDR